MSKAACPHSIHEETNGTNGNWIPAPDLCRCWSLPYRRRDIAFELELPADDTALIHIKSDFDRPPTDLVLHLPWFLEVTAATADGKPVVVSSGAVHLPSSTREVSFTWKHRSDATMSFDRTVPSYEAGYRRRYEHLLSTGQMSSLNDPWQVPEKP